ncbi:Proteasome inhibitor PI31 subunit [Frankliniella fusca]|uniref:Proteasome inhibitor PI31 subunit n=1 Tax=Frankliniella fusca TaxID=407009 RepID=A0AAE1LUS7_9NEOP|nr:Proteasome inhibitor PI31 subunit [Frankliniella fusca]
MSAGFFGLELGFRTVSEAVKRKDDVIVVIVHWFLTRHGFRCIGLGDDKTLSGSENGSELLPDGWSDPETYSLRYVFDGDLFILRGVRADETLILNLLHTPDLNVSNLAVNVNEVVANTNGSVENMVPTHAALIDRIRKELVGPVTKKVSSEATTQTAYQNPNAHPSHPSSIDDVHRDPLRVPIGVGGPGPRPRLDPFNYGRSDLDPLGVGGPGRGGLGGMLFDPFQRGRGMEPPGGLPRGRVPGARFDPIGPPGIGRPGRGFEPDPDHLPPPGYDDMFM